MKKRLAILMILGLVILAWTQTNLGPILVTQKDSKGRSTAPANPPAGMCREYFNSVTGLMTYITSTGASCSPPGVTTPGSPNGSWQGNNAGTLAGIPNSTANFSTGAMSTTAAFTLGGAFNFLSGIQGRPLGITSNGFVQSSLSYWDCSQFTGASIDVIGNTCMGFVITAGGGTADMRGLPTGILNSQFNAWASGPAPLITTSGSGSALNGTYRVVTTLNATGCNNECSSSEEAFIAVPSGQNLVVPSPPYPGTATSYNVYMTAAGTGIGNSPVSWSELKCVSSTPIGNPTTITTAVGCAGNTNLKKTEATEVILPSAPTATGGGSFGGWSCSIFAAVPTYENLPSTYITAPTGKQMCMKWGDQGNVHGASAGEGHRFQILNTSGSTNVDAIVGSDLNGKNGNSYWRVDGFTGSASNSGTPTISRAVCDFESFPDSSQASQMDCLGGQNTTALYVSGGLAGGTGGGAATFFTLHGECSSLTGCIPCSLGLSGVPSTSIAVVGLGCVHAGAGQPNITVQGGAGSLNLDNIYIEGSTDSTTPRMKIGTVGGAGPVIIHGIGFTTEPGGSTAPLIEIENQALTSVLIEGVYKGGSSPVIINDLINGTTVTCSATACLYPGPYVSGKGVGSTLPATFFTGLATNNLSAVGVSNTSGTGACSSTGSAVGSWAGQITCSGTTGASTLVIAPTGGAQHGFVCSGQDFTTPANLLHQSAISNTVNCTLAGTINNGDVILFTVTAY